MYFGNFDFLELLQVCEGEQKFRETKRHPCGKKPGRPPTGKEPETPPAESALRMAPVCKEPPAARARGPRDQDNTRRGEPGIEVQYWNRSDRVTVPTCRAQEHHRPGLQLEESASTSRTTGRGTGRERCEEAPVLWEAPVEGARRVRNQDVSHGRLAWKRVRPQSEGQLGRTLAFFIKESCRTRRPDANDQERCQGERQCGEVTDRRKERRESCYCQETQGSLDYARSP